MAEVLPSCGTASKDGSRTEAGLGENSHAVSVEDARQYLTSLLDRQLRVTLRDGRRVEGTFRCTDSDANIILADCTETWIEDGVGAVQEADHEKKPAGRRMLHLVMVARHNVVSLEICDDSADSTECGKVQSGDGTPSVDGARSYLTALLGKSLCISLSDGRKIVGHFMCTDSEANIILSDSVEHLQLEDGNAKDVELEKKWHSRHVGRVMVPGRHIVAIRISPQLLSSQPISIIDAQNDYEQTDMKIHSISRSPQLNG